MGMSLSVSIGTKHWAFQLDPDELFALYTAGHDAEDLRVATEGQLCCSLSPLRHGSRSTAPPVRW